MAFRRALGARAAAPRAGGPRRDRREPVQRTARVRGRRRGRLLRTRGARRGARQAGGADPLPRGRRTERERQVLRRASRADPGAPARRDRRVRGLAHRGHVPGRPPVGRIGVGAPSRRAGPTGEPDGAARARRARAPPRGPPTPAVGPERARPRDRPVRGGVHARRGRGRPDALPREPRGRRDRSAQSPASGRHPAGRLLRPAVAVSRVRGAVQVPGRGAWCRCRPRSSSGRSPGRPSASTSRWSRASSPRCWPTSPRSPARSR